MDLIHVIPNLRNGGAENMLVNLALQLYERGYKQSIITFKNSKEDFNFSNTDLINDKYILLQRGKKNKFILIKK